MRPDGTAPNKHRIIGSNFGRGNFGRGKGVHSYFIPYSGLSCLVDILVQIINIVFDLQSYLTFRLSTYFTIPIFLRLLTIDHDDVMQVSMHQYFLMVGTKLKLQH